MWRHEKISTQFCDRSVVGALHRTISHGEWGAGPSVLCLQQYFPLYEERNGWVEPGVSPLSRCGHLTQSGAIWSWGNTPGTESSQHSQEYCQPLTALIVRTFYYQKYKHLSLTRLTDIFLKLSCSAPWHSWSPSLLPMSSISDSGIFWLRNINIL